MAAAWYRVQKDFYRTITALELLGGHQLSLVQYCASCYAQAVDNVYFTTQDEPAFDPDIELDSSADVEL